MKSYRLHQSPAQTSEISFEADWARAEKREEEKHDGEVNEKRETEKGSGFA